MTMQQVFVSFADGRNLSNAMDKSSETTVSMADAAHQDAAVETRHGHVFVQNSTVVGWVQGGCDCT